MPVKSREQLAKLLFGVSLETLEKYPERAMKYARGAGTNRTLRALLRKCGYTPEVHNHIWSLLQIAYNIVVPNTKDTFDARTIDAIAFVDAQDEMILELIAACVAPRYPEQASFLTEGLVPSTGMNSVLSMRMFLTRRDQMLKGAERKATRKQDQAALDLLAERGITPELLDRLAQNVEIASSAPDVEPMDEAQIAAADEAYVKALGDIRAWYDEWSRVARVVIKRRDHLILLGLAQRKSPKPGEPEPVEPTDE